MRSRRGLGRGGPGLLGSMARTAVVASTASSVMGRQREADDTRRRLQAVEERERANAQSAVAGGRQPAAAAPPGVDHLHVQLTKLGELRQAGLLTDEEFATQKARLLQA